MVKITGPFIRIVGDRFPWQVKAAILTTLGILLDAAKMTLKPFLPQLQTTFVKSLKDPTKVCTTTVCPQLLFALNYCLPSTTVCPQLLFALRLTSRTLPRR